VKPASDDFGISAFDLATRDKIPLINGLMAAEGDGLALDIGIGTGHTTHAVFGDRQTVCVDLHAPNLERYRGKTSSGAGSALCVVARATQLPFQPDIFRFVLCSEVIEHLEDDDEAVREIERVLTDDGRAVITVPYTGLGFTGFLELCGIKTVHDFPGPEHHVRPGYDVDSLRDLLARHGLEIESHTYYLRFFTKLAVDVVSLAHLIYQRVVHGRRTWTWSEATAVQSSVAFRLYTWIFPIVWAFSRIDRVLLRLRGFGLIALAKKR
jgi:SAM-dependent methyltransferase